MTLVTDIKLEDKPFFEKPIELQFALPQNIQQIDALEAFETLNEQQRTELLTDMFIFWHTWHTQYQLAAMGGLE